MEMVSLAMEAVASTFSLYLFQSTDSTSPSCAGAITAAGAGELVSHSRTEWSPEQDTNTFALRGDHSAWYTQYVWEAQIVDFLSTPPRPCPCTCAHVHAHTHAHAQVPQAIEDPAAVRRAARRD